MRTQELKKVILRLVGNREFYGYEIHRQLEERNINIGIGRLYSILTDMKGIHLLFIPIGGDFVAILQEMTVIP